jgi:hypothetical protein
MRTGDAFPSTYLKQSDVGDRRLLLTVDRVEIQDVGQGDQQEQKPCLYFAGHKKAMVLNRGNADAVTEIVGTDEMDDWSGHKVVIYVDRNVTYGGKRVGGLRISAPPNGSKPAPKPKPAPPVEEALPGEFEASDEDVPF